MFKSFTLAVLAVAVSASMERPSGEIRNLKRSRDRYQEQMFLDFLSTNNKSVGNAKEFSRKERNFERACSEIKKINSKAVEAKKRGKKDPVVAALNWTADLDLEEY